MFIKDSNHGTLQIYAYRWRASYTSDLKLN